MNVSTCIMSTIPLLQEFAKNKSTASKRIVPANIFITFHSSVHKPINHPNFPSYSYVFSSDLPTCLYSRFAALIASVRIDSFPTRCVNGPNKDKNKAPWNVIHSNKGVYPTSTIGTVDSASVRGIQRSFPGEKNTFSTRCKEMRLKK